MSVAQRPGTLDVVRDDWVVERKGHWRSSVGIRRQFASADRSRIPRRRCFGPEHQAMRRFSPLRLNKKQEYVVDGGPRRKRSAGKRIGEGATGRRLVSQAG